MGGDTERELEQSIGDLTLGAWTWALKKTGQDLSSREAAERVMFTKAQEVTRYFVLEKVERGETRGDPAGP